MDGMIGEATMEQEPYGISRIIKKICDNYCSYEKKNLSAYKNLVDKYDNKSSTNKFISIMENLVWKKTLSILCVIYIGICYQKG